MINRLLVFDLKGKIAHFRKFYTSSSSLSYAFPPRTVITGLIAAILGRERDTYYEEFDTNACKIALSIRSPIRKLIQTVNYIRTKKSGDKKKSEESFASTSETIKSFIEKRIIKYPTPIELVVPKDFTGEIVYRVYFWHQDGEVMDGLGQRIREKKSVYPLYLGLSEFLAEVEPIDEPSGEAIKEESAQQSLEISSVLRADYIEELLFEEADTPLQYISEKMPVEFGRGRSIKKNEDFIYEKNQKMVRARLKIPCMELFYKERDRQIKENIICME